jgi:hypothetical protein
MPTKWYLTRWFVLLMLTPLALGPFALPLLWKSPRFSRTAKWLLTLFTMGWTLWLIWYAHDHMAAVAESLVDRIMPGAGLF